MIDSTRIEVPRHATTARGAPSSSRTKPRQKRQRKRKVGRRVGTFGEVSISSKLQHLLAIRYAEVKFTPSRKDPLETSQVFVAQSLISRFSPWIFPQPTCDAWHLTCNNNVSLLPLVQGNMRSWKHFLRLDVTEMCKLFLVFWRFWRFEKKKRKKFQLIQFFKWPTKLI
jgi:hypothetical protein